MNFKKFLIFQPCTSQIIGKTFKFKELATSYWSQGDTPISQFDIENEPLFHNNSILPCLWEGFTLADYRRLKDKVRKGDKT
jgi:hypothetical protein